MKVDYEDVKEDYARKDAEIKELKALLYTTKTNYEQYYTRYNDLCLDLNALLAKNQNLLRG